MTSRFRMRGTEQYERIAACIHSTVSQRHGNYMVFFPSYKFLDKVLERYGEMYPEDDETAFAVQSPMMTEVEREAFLERFEEARDDRSLIGFCVLGGIFSEGIDLRQDRLIGALIVGTGFPQVCAEREILNPDGEGRRSSGAHGRPVPHKPVSAAVSGGVESEPSDRQLRNWG